MSRLLALSVIVISEDVDGRCDVAHEVEPHADFGDDGPGRRPVVARREHKRVAGLTRQPIVLEHVRFDEHASGILQLEEVLDGPGGIRRTPFERFGHIVAAKRDVARYEAIDRRLRTAKHDVLSRGFEVVVLDHIRSGTVPAADRLAVLSNGLDLADVGVSDRRGSAVQGNPALLPTGRIAAHDEAVQLEMVRHPGKVALFRAPVSQQDDVASPTHVRLERQPLQPPVMRPRCRGQRGCPVRGPEPRHPSLVFRSNAAIDGKMRRGCTGADRDELGAGRFGQREVPDVEGTRFEQDLIAGSCSVDGGLQIAAGQYGDTRQLRARHRSGVHNDEKGHHPDR